MSKCNNCGTKLGCSCKRRTASDGTSCCASCISSYEKKKQTTKSNYPTGTILNVTATQKP